MTSEAARTALNLHNELRAQHSAPPLQWSYELQRAAESHATALLSRKSGDPLAAASGVKYGQNVFELQTNAEISDKLAVERALDSWYKEREDYNPNVQSGSSGLNFSQLVWRSTEKLGLGIARKPGSDGMSKIVVVAFYDPSGNFRGEFAANVTVNKSALSTTTSNRRNSSNSTSSWQDNKMDTSSSSPSSRSNNWSSTVTTTKTIPGGTTIGGTPAGQESSTSTWRTTTTTTTTRSSKTMDGGYDAPNNSPISTSSFPANSNSNNTQQQHHVRFNSTTSNTSSNNQPAAGIRTTTTTNGVNTTKEVNTGNVTDVAVQMHNEYRRKHRAPPVKLDQKLCEDAQKYARSIVMGNNQTKENLGVGRNVYRLTTTGTTVDHAEAVKKAITKWYSQADEYNWSAPLASGFGANLWTQLVWKGSTSIGVGVATKADQGLTAVCVLYSPPGNIASEQSYRENVFPAAY